MSFSPWTQSKIFIRAVDAANAVIVPSEENSNEKNKVLQYISQFE